MKSLLLQLAKESLLTVAGISLVAVVIAAIPVAIYYVSNWYSWWLPWLQH